MRLSINCKMSKRRSFVWCIGICLFLTLIMTGIRTTPITVVYVQTQTSKANEEEPKDEHPFCPSVVREKVGLFDEKNSRSSVKDEFQDTILLVSSNYAYYNMLQNWEFLAHEHDLKWAVLALDEKLFEVLGPDRAVPPQHEFSVSGEHGWGRGNFQKLSCNKMRMAMEIANNCKVNVVFTDVDNIFFQNPFEHDLGQLIRSKRYDYLYQPNRAVDEPRINSCLQGKPHRENNTGFYYIRHGSKIYTQIIEQTLQRCQDPENKIDDQTLFWEEFWNVRNNLTREKKASFRHCKLDEYENPLAMLPSDKNRAKIESFKWCCMDPYYYPIGKRREGPSNPDPVTYHANFAASYAVKVEKLTYARSDHHGWDISRFEDGVGGVLTDKKEE